jgi:hypothetical protein
LDTISFFKSLSLKKGDFFVQHDKIYRHIAFVNYGMLKTFYINEKGEEITSCFCQENNFTTYYKSFILQKPSKLIIQALEDTQLWIIDYENLQKLYSISTVWQTIGRAIDEKEYIVMEQYASVLNNETAKEQYLRLLNEQPYILQKASTADIATYLGITRSTLSRIRQEISK